METQSPYIVTAYRQAADTDPDTEADPHPAPHLTPREIQVLELLANGTTIKQAAHRLHVSRRNIVRLLGRARERLGAKTRDETIARAVARGWIALG